MQKGSLFFSIAKYISFVSRFLSYPQSGGYISPNSSPFICIPMLDHVNLQSLLPPMRETQVRSLGQEDPLEEEMATLSSTLAWKNPWMEEPGGLQSMGWQIVRPTEGLRFHFPLERP